VQKVWVFLVLFVGLNIVAWDWVDAEHKSAIALPLYEGTERAGYYNVTVYYGINPGIIIHSAATSIVLSLFIGGVLPFFIAGALSRRQKPLEVIPRAAAGAPR
jgi:hypothetical protein